jgi:N-formylglutamate deformylase
MALFRLTAPTATPVPIVLSIPHCGTRFPAELKGHFRPALAETPDDTDWFVQKLYAFAPAMGISVIYANYSRWVIDLNRHPEDRPLYNDGRLITGLCPVTSFTGESLYVDNRTEVEPGEIKRRLESYYNPYHEQVRKKLFEMKQRFGKVILWECHSIRQFVETIYKGKIPDLILGDADQTTASPDIINTVKNIFAGSKYEFSHNHPFKGGHITRYFGKPADNQHALQLEMTKVNYMDDSETRYDESRAQKMQILLKKVFTKLIQQLT